MPMGTIQKQKFQAWLQANMPHYPPTCTCCGQQNWDFDEIVDTTATSGILTPMVRVVCQTCGQILLFDAKKARLV